MTFEEIIANLPKPFYNDEYVAIYHADCRDILPLIPDKSIDLVLTSPPYYNLREYAQWDNYDLYLEDVKEWFKILASKIGVGRYICWNIQNGLPNPQSDGRHYYALMPDTVKIAMFMGFEWQANIVWNKKNATQMMFGSYPYPPNIIYSYIEESICIFRSQGQTNLKNKTDASKIPVPLWNKYHNNIWEFPAETNSNHSAPFPIQLPNNLIIFHSFVNDLILDPFLGSGTTAYCAKKLNRKCIGIEIEEKYCEIAAKRCSQGVFNLVC